MRHDAHLDMAIHPRYQGPVVDAHCHYDATTRERAAAINAMGGVSVAINLWDVVWPPTPYAEEAHEYRAFEPALVRCHVPDLTRIGQQGYARRLADGVHDALAAGCVGIKVWKNLGLRLLDDAGARLAIDDRRLDVLWQAAAEAGLPIVIHVGDHPAFWAPIDERNPRAGELRLYPDFYYGKGDFPSLEQIHDEFERLVSNHPDTIFVGAHFGCFMRWPEVNRMLREHANYRVDTAAAVAEMGATGFLEARVMGTNGFREVREIILEHPDRIIFGTDLSRTAAIDLPALGADRWNLRRFFETHWRFFETAETGLDHPLPQQGDLTITGLDLPAEVLERIYHLNAVATFRLPEIVVNPPSSL